MSVEPKRSNSDDEESKKEAPTAFVGNSATITSMPDLVTITEDEFNQLTLYEKKATLINQEMDKMGFGRYQLCIFFLCGFGYFLDLMWSQSLALILGPLAQEFGVSAEKQPNIYTASNTGLTVGALFWGLSVDIIGRKWAFNLTCLITSVFGLLIAAPPHNFDAVCAIVALSSFGLGGNIPIDATITLEFLPTRNRWLLGLLSMFQPLGVTICTILAYGFIPSYSCAADLPDCASGQTPCCNRASNLGWRYLEITLGCITLAIFFARTLLFDFKESPKYLLSRGKEQEAIDVLHYIAKFNKAAPPKLTVETLRALADPTASGISDPTSTQGMLTSEPNRSLLQQTKHVVRSSLHGLSHLKGLFSSKTMTFTVIFLWLAYASDYWSFTLASGFLPLILQRRGAEANQSLRDTYRSYIAIYTPGIGGSIFAAAAMEIPKVGRKWSMILFAALQAVSIGLYVKITNIPGSIGLNAMEYIFQTAYNGLLYAYAPEIFPAPYRGSAVGMASTIGRLSAIVAPKAAADYYADPNSNGVLWLSLGGILVSMVSLMCLPVETRGRQAF